MKTSYIGKDDLDKRLSRNDAFWQNKLEDGPLMWITVPNAKQGMPPALPEKEEEIWTNVEYYIEKAEFDLSHTYYAGDSLPVCHPWLGPDQFAAWMGAEMLLKPKEFTSWVKPFVNDWNEYPEFKIDPENKWWKLYLELLKASSEYGKDKWITAFPDLHTGIDGMAAMRGPENLMMELITIPEQIHRVLGQMTDCWKYIVDVVSEIIGNYGQGSSNWTMGWSSKRFICVGQNDFSAMIGNEMFREFFLKDNIECTNHCDYSIYHLDGKEALQHLPDILQLEKLTTVQWVQGAGNPQPSHWLPLLQNIQNAGKSVQLLYELSTTNEIDINKEVKMLCENLDTSKLFVLAIIDSVEKADDIVKSVRNYCKNKK